MKKHKWLEYRDKEATTETVIWNGLQYDLDVVYNKFVPLCSVFKKAKHYTGVHSVLKNAGIGMSLEEVEALGENLDCKASVERVVTGVFGKEYEAFYSCMAECQMRSPHGVVNSVN